jgi:hypothetical protein
MSSTKEFEKERRNIPETICFSLLPVFRRASLNEDPRIAVVEDGNKPKVKSKTELGPILLMKMKFEETNFFFSEKDPSKN